MKITESQPFPVRLIAEPAEIFSGPRARSADDTVILRVATDEGIVGFGEATPVPGQSVGALLEWLRAYGAELLGADPLNINSAHRVMDGLFGQPSPDSRLARAAFDMAIYDIAGKFRGCPVHELLGGAYRSDFERLAGPEDSPSPATAEAAHDLVNAGFRALKVSIGDPTPGIEQTPDRLAGNVRNLRAILDAVGSDIYVDAEGSESWMNPALVTRAFEHLLSDRFYPNLSVEQPLGALDMTGHAFLREKLLIPVILDESVTSPEAAIAIVQMGAADRVVVNLGRVGGLLPAMRIADICEAAAIGVSVEGGRGSRLGDTAHCHFAAAIRDPYPLHLAGEAKWDKSPATGGFELRDGRVSLLDRAGLGVDVDEAWLQTIAISR